MSSEEDIANAPTISAATFIFCRLMEDHQSVALYSSRHLTLGAPFAIVPNAGKSGLCHPLV
jgi:hypothetical protein